MVVVDFDIVVGPELRVEGCFVVGKVETELGLIRDRVFSGFVGEGFLDVEVGPGVLGREFGDQEFIVGEVVGEDGVGLFSEIAPRLVLEGLWL